MQSPSINTSQHTSADFQPHIQNLLHHHSSLAVCLNQLRKLKIQFLNLGNVIICPEQQCYFIFQAKQLNRIELFSTECSSQQI